MIRLVLIINLLGLALLQVGLIVEARLMLHWIPLGWVWSISTGLLIGVGIFRTLQVRHDQLNS